jgi:hypothetical protein
MPYAARSPAATLAAGMSSTMRAVADGTELAAPFGLDNKKFEALFPGIKGLRYDSFHKRVGFPAGVRPTFNGEGSKPVARVIFFKKNPSLHKCDARCLNATGHNCECSCGGKNHGANG